MKSLPLMHPRQHGSQLTPEQLEREQVFVHLPDGSTGTVPRPIMRVVMEQPTVGLLLADGEMAPVSEYVAQVIAERDWYREQVANLKAELQRLESRT